MKTVVLTHPKIQGKLIIEYSDNGYIHKFEFECEHSIDLINFMFDRFPIHYSGLKDKDFKNFTITETVAIPEFEEFWQQYGKIGSKKRAEAKWNRMSNINKIEALKYIPRYCQSLTNDAFKAYAERYLNLELWIK